MSADKEAFSREQRDLCITIESIRDLLGRAQLSYYEVIALGTLLQNVYMGVERIFRMCLRSKGFSPASSETWHKELLMKALAEGIIKQEDFAVLGDLLAFRHHHMHGYASTLKEERLRELAACLPEAVEAVLSEARFRMGIA